MYELWTGRNRASASLERQQQFRVQYNCELTTTADTGELGTGSPWPWPQLTDRAHGDAP